MLIDTHCHINMITKKSFSDFDKPLQEEDFQQAETIIAAAQASQVNTILNIGTSVVESINSLELAKRFKNIYACIGIHPNDLQEDWLNDMKIIEDFLKSKDLLKIKALGECGLDYHYPNYNKDRQYDGFKAHIDLSLEYNIPLVIHTRSAGSEVLDILKSYKNHSLFHNLKGVIHCFSEDINFATRAVDLGFVLGIGGAVTYPKNNFLREVVKIMGINNIVLETDAPFLPPQHMRGKKNYPEYIKSIAQYIANLLELPFEEVAKITTLNSKKLFKF